MKIKIKLGWVEKYLKTSKKNKKKNNPDEKEEPSFLSTLFNSIPHFSIANIIGTFVVILVGWQLLPEIIKSTNQINNTNSTVALENISSVPTQNTSILFNTYVDIAKTLPAWFAIGMLIITFYLVWRTVRGYTEI